MALNSTKKNTRRRRKDLSSRTEQISTVAWIEDSPSQKSQGLRASQAQGCHMASEPKILDVVCKIVRGKQLKARAVVSELRKRKIKIDRKDLNRLLYRLKPARPGL